MSNITPVLDAASFHDALSIDGSIVLYFSASWCAPCKTLEPVLERVLLEYPTVKALKIDVEKFQGIASKYGVSGLPTLVFMRRKMGAAHIFDIVGGSVGEDTIRECLDKIARNSLLTSDLAYGINVLTVNKWPDIQEVTMESINAA